MDNEENKIAKAGQESTPAGSDRVFEQKNIKRRNPHKAQESRKSPDVKKDAGTEIAASQGRQKEEPVAEFVEKVLSIKRVTKVTKGGKKLSFSALVVVGDGKGQVGFGHEKAREVAAAIKKSLGIAKKNMFSIRLKGTTIPHEVIGINGAARVLLKPASDGTGVIASGAVRAVCEGAGIRNILTKCHRSNNPINVVKATLNGLTRLKSKKE